MHSTLSSRERLIRVFNGVEVDRIPTYDIIHSIELIEFITDEKITPRNAEDLVCKAASQVLDLIRHFAVPDFFGDKIVEDNQGFVYKYEWWTGHLIKRPDFQSVEDVARTIDKDIENIHDCIDKKKVCSAANQHVNLFYEKCETFEEIKSEYIRISEKLDGTVMMGPEGVQGIGVIQERYDYKWWVYLYNDYPELASTYLDALMDYELAFIESFADFNICPIAFSSCSVGMNDRLLYPVEFFREHIVPRKKKVLDKWKKYGLYHIFFLDGYKLPVLEDFINLGTDGIDPLEPYAGIDILKFRQKYPGIVICQPIDCGHLLQYGAEADVEKAVIKAIEDSGKNKIIIGSTSEIHPRTNIINAMCMYRTARNYVL